MTNKYFTFRQNNSHGSYYGPKFVIVNAPNAEAANEFAEKHTDVYFDYEYESDCECCGMRWYPQYSEFEGDESPSISYDGEELVDHSEWLGLERVDNSSKETWALYEDYNDPTKITNGMSVDNFENWNRRFFLLNELKNAPEGSTIYGIKTSWETGMPVKVTVDFDELVEHGIDYNEVYHWDEMAIDIVLKHKQEEFRQEQKARKKKNRRD